MAETGNKKKRIARIGSISSGKGTGKLHSEDGLMQADCSLVYDIMQSMNMSQNVMSYQQLQEFRSKEKSSSRTKNSHQNSSSKKNGTTLCSKQLKKLFPEKTFPLMAKCQKSMKYLKKNRCIPKPRAHVGSIPRPSQNSVSSFKPDNIRSNDSVSNSTQSPEACSAKLKRISKRSRYSPEVHDSLKKTKISHSVNNSCEINEKRIQKEISEKEPKFTSDTDSENEFEQFLQKHHPEKCVRRKNEKINKIRRKSKFICSKKIAKVTSRTLSDFEQSDESEIECQTLTKNKCTSNKVEELAQKRFNRIIEYENSGDSSADSRVCDSGMNYDSSSSSEEENGSNFGDSEKLNTLPAVRSFDSSTSFSELKDTLCSNELKLKCTPCYVVIKRDTLLDKKAASLCTANSSITNAQPVSNSYEDDECVIISETATKDFTNQNSENITHSKDIMNSSREYIISKSPSVSKATTDRNDAQKKHVLSEELISSSNILRPHIETNSSEMSTEIVCIDTNMPLEKAQKYGIEIGKVSLNTSASRKSLCDIEEDGCFTSSKATKHSHKNINSEYEEKSTLIGDPIPRHISDLPSNEADVSMNSDTVTSATERELFNVQITSVKSLNESDIIVLSDDNEEKEPETVPSMNETKESAAEDSDIEIICLGSGNVKEKCVNGNVKDDVNNETHNKDESLKIISNQPSVQPITAIEDDCIILDDLDLPSKNTCSTKIVEKMQSSQVVAVINNEKATSANALDLNKKSILEILDTLDRDCIDKVIKETTVTDIQKHNNPEKPKPRQIDSRLSQKLVSMDASITPIGKVNKTNSLKTSPCDTREKHPEVIEASDVLPNKNRSENVPSAIKWNNIPSSYGCDNSSAVFASSSNLTGTKLIESGKEFIAFNQKMEPNALLRSQENKQFPVYTKTESYESPSDELDIIASKSIQSLDVKEKTIMPLLNLYRNEYDRYKEIISTEQNVSEGLKLLEEKQAKRLRTIAASIKNIVKKDECFHKIINEFGSNQNKVKSFIKGDSAKTDGSLDEIKKPLKNETRASIGNFPDVAKDDKVIISGRCIVNSGSEALQSVGSSSSQEENYVINIVCAECGEPAVAACLGCEKVYYCSQKCGMSSWHKGHYATCNR